MILIFLKHFFYLMGLPENERNAQITMIVAFYKLTGKDGVKDVELE